MQIPTWTECFIWEFWSLPMSILDDPLDVAFAISVYTKQAPNSNPPTNSDTQGQTTVHALPTGMNRSESHLWSATSKPWIAVLIC
jgi:hypothetical protein